MAWVSAMVARKAVQAAQFVSVALIVTSPLQAAPCVNLEAARKASYTPYIELVVDDIKAIDRGRGDAAFTASMNELSSTYARGATAGSAGDVRKLIGIGLFTAMASNAEPLDVTFKLVCESAKKLLPPRNVLDPLACAVIAVDRSRRQAPANRQLANDMIELARSTLASDPDPVSARNAFAAISQPVLQCLSQP
jgi:hypothetical protein